LGAIELGQDVDVKPQVASENMVSSTSLDLGPQPAAYASDLIIFAMVLSAFILGVFVGFCARCCNSRFRRKPNRNGATPSGALDDASFSFKDESPNHDERLANSTPAGVNGGDVVPILVAASFDGADFPLQEEKLDLERQLMGIATGDAGAEGETAYLVPPGTGGMRGEGKSRSTSKVGSTSKAHSEDEPGLTTNRS
jgi:hypothetical protein